MGGEGMCVRMLRVRILMMVVMMMMVGTYFIIVDSLSVKVSTKTHLFTCFVTQDIQLWIRLNVSIEK